MGENQSTGLALGKLQALAGEAKAGTLVLDPSVAAQCATACDNLIKELDAARTEADRLDVTLDLGDFDCGKKLSDSLHTVAAGKDGLKQRLDEHVAAVQQISAMVGASVAAVQTSDSHTSDAVRNVGSQVGGR